MEINQEAIIALVAFWGVRILAAILILIVGKWLANKVAHLMRIGMGKRNVEPSLVAFLCNLVYYAALAAVIIAAIGQLGVKTTSFIAVLGAAGLAVGLALQGSLSNFAAGTLLLLFRPFRFGDYIQAGGTGGTVQEIGMLMTILHSPDNQKIFVPNSQIMSDTITNFSVNPTRRIDLEIGISYEDDIERAKEVIWDIIRSHPKILADPEPTVELWSLGESSVNLVVRPWTNRDDWFATRCEILPEIKKRLEAEGISLPYPQRDVHLYQK